MEVSESTSGLGVNGLMPIAPIFVLPSLSFSLGAASFVPRFLFNRRLGVVLDGLVGYGLVASRLYLHRSWLDPFFSIGPCQKK